MTPVFDGHNDALTRPDHALIAVGRPDGHLDLPRMRRLLETWPEGGWGRWQVTEAYRGALLHAVSAGHFIRRVAEQER